ncbi:hypothetical protein HNQ77_002942 [Silvibacterium bohemicum]|uniref:Uncharacterized protein n=1 Tax=Silvibacterium bohemicum TaxID=1577686 RepID=A0A841JUF9_9BACT|nr:hypothetical protein [Silvibacterium bohemicum]MBB6144986.1 hypothetical protein [Silvibacterium bohemicum]
MSVAGILASSLFSSFGSHQTQKPSGTSSSKTESFESDLQSGNLSGAQSMFSILQQKLTAQGLNVSGSAVSSEMTQLGSDLKSGNITAAKGDYATLKQTLSHNNGVSQTQHPKSTGALQSAVESQSNQLTVALQAYGSLQQNPLVSGQSNSLLPNSSSLGLYA